jgi:hypothetical protein
MIEYRELTKEESARRVHFCGRCATWQPRVEIHECSATKRWKLAKGIPLDEENEAEAELDARAKCEPHEARTHP